VVSCPSSARSISLGRQYGTHSLSRLWKRDFRSGPKLPSLWSTQGDRTTTAAEGARQQLSSARSLLLIAFFLFLIYLWTPQGRGSKERAEGAPDEAASMCQGFVKDRLMTPSTAKFPSVYSADTKTDKLSLGHYRVRSYVDAQNSFGAQIRTPYVCEVRRFQTAMNGS
jgi:hypothetical protein